MQAALPLPVSLRVGRLIPRDPQKYNFEKIIYGRRILEKHLMGKWRTQ